MPPELAQVVVEYDLNGQAGESVLYAEHLVSSDMGITFHSAAYTNDDLQPLLDQFHDWANANLKNNLTAEASVTGLKVTRNEAAPGGPLVQIADAVGTYPVVGTNNSALPNNVTIAVEHLTAFIGRSYRGRTYQPGMPEAYVTLGAGANVVNSTGIAQILDTWAQLQVKLETAFGLSETTKNSFVVASFVHAGAPRAVAIYNRVVSSVFSDLNLDSMKDRLPGK